jgi:hypothetical protein
MRIHEFHSKLDLRHDQGTLFDALRRLRLMNDLKSMEEAAGWIVWTDDATQDPEGGSFRLALARA